MTKKLSKSTENRGEGMSKEARIFQDLSLDKKREYFKDQYGTVKGTTGFFDYWYKKGIKDVQTLSLSGEDSLVSACIVLSGGSYEGGGVDSSNYILAIIGDNVYTSQSVKYYETRYSTDLSTGKSVKKVNVDKPASDYQKIVNIRKGDEDDYIATVETDNGEKEVPLGLSGKHGFEKSLLGKLYEPKDLSEAAENLSNESKQAILSDFEISRDYDKEAMFLESLEVLADQGDEDDMINVILGSISSRGYSSDLKHDKLSSSPKLDRYILKVLEENHSDNLRRSLKYKHAIQLIELISDPKLKEEQLLKLFNYYIGKPDKNISDISSLIELTPMLPIKKDEAYEMIFHAYYEILEIPFESYSFYNALAEDRDEHYKHLHALLGGKEENYKLLYDTVVKKTNQGQYLLNEFASDSKNKIKAVIAFFKSVGMDIKDDLFSNSTKFKLNGWNDLKKFFPTLLELEEEGLIATQHVDEIIKNNEEAILLSFPSSVDRDFYRYQSDHFLNWSHQLYERYNIEYRFPYYCALLYKYRKSEDEAWSIIKENHQKDHEITKELIKQAFERDCYDFLLNLDKKGYPVSKEIILGIAEDHFKAGRMEQLKELELQYHFIGFEENRDKVYDTDYAEGKIAKDPYESLSYIPFVSHEFLKKIVNKSLNPEEELYSNYREPNEIIRQVLAVILEQEDFTADYINNLLEKLYKNKSFNEITILLEARGLKIDKSLVSKYIKELIKQGDLENAYGLIESSGLEESFIRDYIIIALEKNKDIWRLQEKINDDEELKKLQKIQRVNGYMKRGNLMKGLKYAEQNDILISPAQIAKYREAVAEKIEQERQRRAEEERAKMEKEERLQKLAQEMMPLVVEDKFLVDIEWKRDQKYVFVYTEENGPMLLSRPLQWRVDIVKEFNLNEKDVLGGGWIKIDDDEKLIKLHGISGSYGSIHQTFFKIIDAMLKEHYPDYTIVRE